MRRILAITLLIAFGSPLAVPLLAAAADLQSKDAQSSLPACCRRNGKHHCAITMAAALASVNGSSPAFQAPPCPLYPSSSTLPTLVTAALTTPRTFSVALLRATPPRASSLLRAHSSIPSSNHQRGPPALLA
jgi:hypothetical protein